MSKDGGTVCRWTYTGSQTDRRTWFLGQPATHLSQGNLVQSHVRGPSTAWWWTLQVRPGALHQPTAGHKERQAHSILWKYHCFLLACSEPTSHYFSCLLDNFAPPSSHLPHSWFLYGLWFETSTVFCCLLPGWKIQVSLDLSCVEAASLLCSYLPRFPVFSPFYISLWCGIQDRDTVACCLLYVTWSSHASAGERLAAGCSDAWEAQKVTGKSSWKKSNKGW